MAKKKMTPAQAAAARRPDDWEPPQTNEKPSKKKKVELHSGASVIDEYSSKENRKTAIGFIVLFVVAAIAAPFIVIYVSQFLGIG